MWKDVERALREAVETASLLDHECQLLAIRWGGEVGVVEAFGVVGFEGGEVLTNEAQIGRT